MRAKMQRLLVLMLAACSLLLWSWIAKAADLPEAVTSIVVNSSSGSLGTFQTLEGAGSLSEILEMLGADGVSRKKISGELRHENVSLTRVIDKDKRASEWRVLVETGKIENARRDLSIDALGEDGRPIVTAQLFAAWPSALIVEKPASGAAAIERLTIAHEGFLLLLDPVTAVARGIISSPADGAVYYVPKSLPLAVSLTENPGAAVRVRFLVNGVEIGTDSDGSNGFSFPWNAPAPGFYTLKAEIVSTGDTTSPTPAVALQVKEQIKLGLNPKAIAENQPIKSVVGIFTVEGTENATVSLVPGTGASENSSFSVDSVKRLLSEAVFDHETLAAASIRVRAVANDGIGGMVEQVFVIGITDGPEEAGPRLKEDVMITYNAQSDSTKVDLSFVGGIHGRAYTVEASNDLKEWAVIGSYPANESGTFSLEDTTPGKVERRFWRVRW